ncbi:uncharacterized protein LOC122644988 [Telopea speciosissima]|uniref:uncharacterized protein LOC122644988 n=1 Tax=Telopea speciosissima TaxID=54955 RepID=UPI001CC8220A|nr:uncharacterized protein LOC122644988 [Telopea speciosissima]
MSDHCPVVVDRGSPLRCRGKQFYFFNHWSEHAEFLPLVEQIWSQPLAGSPMSILLQKLHLLKTKLKGWSRALFHNLDGQVEELKAELDRLQSSALTCNPDGDLVRRERETANRLHKIMNIREFELRQKSRVKWLQNGDSNSDFFHRSLWMRRAQNCITAIHDSNGDLISDEDAICVEATRFFESTFMGTSQIICNPLDLPVDRALDSLEAAEISKDFTADEVKAVVFSMDDHTTPGTDGFGAMFFKKTWDITGSDVVAAILSFF